MAETTTVHTHRSQVTMHHLQTSLRRLEHKDDFVFRMEVTDAGLVKCPRCGQRAVDIVHGLNEIHTLWHTQPMLVGAKSSLSCPHLCDDLSADKVYAGPRLLRWLKLRPTARDMTIAALRAIVRSKPYRDRIEPDPAERGCGS